MRTCRRRPPDHPARVGTCGNERTPCTRDSFLPGASSDTGGGNGGDALNQGKQERPNWNHLVGAGLAGVLIGAWWVNNRTEEAKRSRAEREDREEVEGVCEEIGEVLDHWEPPDDCEDEDDFRDDLAEYLEANTECEIEITPGTSEGKPDILIDDTLALELKYDPSKAELDRCVGQCMSDSREWVTWIVLIDSHLSKVGRLERLLADKGLERQPAPATCCRDLTKLGKLSRTSLPQLSSTRTCR